ncbi:MAG: hypothetical protein JXB88_23990 [Spirochaetales bacterium]|nr:hypothetical protein [Spirochaetales bacterium]
MKDNLSKYLKLVRAGEIVLVMDRDEVIAEIHKPTIPMPEKLDPWQAFLNNEEYRGIIKQAITETAPSLFELKKLTVPGNKVNLQKLFDEVKGE